MCPTSDGICGSRTPSSQAAAGTVLSAVTKKVGTRICGCDEVNLDVLQRSLQAWPAGWLARRVRREFPMRLHSRLASGAVGHEDRQGRSAWGPVNQEMDLEMEDPVHQRDGCFPRASSTPFPRSSLILRPFSLSARGPPSHFRKISHNPER